MPGSYESEDSPTSIISSLRHFRFARKTEQYKPPSTTEVNCIKKDPEEPDSTENGNNSPTALSSRSNNSQSLSHSSASKPYVYSPLSYRKYEAKTDSQSILSHLATKIQNSVGASSSAASECTCKLTTEELQKIKDLVLQDYSLSEKWNLYVSQESLCVDSPSERLLKVNRWYLNELLKLVRGADKNSIFYTGDKTVHVVGTCTSVRTYSRVKSSKSPQHTAVVTTTEQESKQKKRGMDDWDVFCDKEQNLKKLLDAFPGADIMEAQDILARCNWNLEQALKAAQLQPLKPVGKKRTSSTGSSADNGKAVKEEIVLDSSDEEVMKPRKANGRKTSSEKVPAAPPAKKVRRILSSSDSEDESYKPTKYTSVLLKQSADPPQHHTQTRSLTEKTSTPAEKMSVTTEKPGDKISVPSVAKKPTVEKPVSNQERLSVEKMIAEKNISSSLSIKPLPSSESSSRPVQHKVAAPENSLPNLPKGITLLQVEELCKPNGKAAQSVRRVSAESVSVSQLNSKSGVSIVPQVNAKNSSTISSQIMKAIPAAEKLQNSNKSAQMIRIKQGDSNVISSGNTISLPKSLSITPISKQVSITPVPSSNSSNTKIENMIAMSDMTPSTSTFSNSNSVKATANSSSEDHSRPKKMQGKHRINAAEDDIDDEEYGNDLIFDSDDSDFEVESLTSAHSAVLKFFQESTVEELVCVPGCSKKKVEAIMKIKPFSTWGDLVEKLSNHKYLSTDLLNGAKKVLDMRSAVNKIMAKCQRISIDMEDLVESLKENRESSTDYVSKQPELLSDRMHLTPYQMLGLNWLLLMHNQEVNGILADEMGLGKTAQAIAFLAYLKQITRSGPHLIVVPSSVLDNWKQEFTTWWPDVSIVCYHGSQDSRRELRLQILNDEVEEFDAMITTYNMVTSSSEDRGFFKRIEFDYVVFDEAHMLKNMSSQRYQHLMRIKAPRRLLLTGTPLQNNLVELMSLLIFAMPNMFHGKTDHVKQMFSAASKGDGNKSTYERDRIEHAKRIMKPFVLRRLKKDVLQDLPIKRDETRMCTMTEDQAKKYSEVVEKLSAEVRNDAEREASTSGSGMMMQLRRAANHPLLLRRFYDDSKLLKMSTDILKEPTHTESNPDLVFEDMSVMSDFELHKLCKSYKSLKSYALPNENIVESGKFRVLDKLLPDLIEEEHRILLFSQFTMVLDIIQEYMNIKKYKFLRLDGQVPVQDRQQLIDNFNSDPTIFVFLLSTRAGGLGINLTAADTVILHDIDFNPYNDKQAEDRCHRVGQVRDVTVIRFISENTIEEGILQRATEKLKLERDIHEENELDDEENDTASVAKLLRDALGITHKGASKS